MSINSPSRFSSTTVGVSKADPRYTFSSANVYWVPRKAQLSNASNFIASIFSGAALTNEMGGKWLRSSDRYREEGSDVLGCSWSKDTSSPAGTFSLTLKPTKQNDYLSRLSNGDLLIIYMDSKLTKDSNGILQTIGTIDRVGEARQVAGNGTTMLTVSVSGRDLGKVLQETATVFDPTLTAQALVYFTQSVFSSQLLKRCNFSPVEVVMLLMKLFFVTNATKSQVVGQQWRLPGDPSKGLLNAFLEVGNFVQYPMYGWMAASIPAFSASPNVYSLIDSFANKTINEMFFDVRDTGSDSTTSTDYASDVSTSYCDGTDIAAQQAAVEDTGAGFVPIQQNATSFSMIFRQLPYDVDVFNKLPLSVLDERECYSVTTGKASHEVFNFFRLLDPSLGPQFQEIAYGIVVNEESVKAFGIKRLDVQSRYTFPSAEAADDYNTGKKSTIDLTAAIKYYLGVIKTWNVANEDLYAGQITCRLRPDIRVGTRLRHKFTALSGDAVFVDYYVQAVSHQFSYQQGASRTSLTLIRGIHSVDSVKSYVSKATWSESGSGVEAAFTRFTASGSEQSGAKQDTPKDTSSGIKPSVKTAIQNPGQDQ